MSSAMTKSDQNSGEKTQKSETNDISTWVDTDSFDSARVSIYKSDKENTTAHNTDTKTAMSSTPKKAQVKMEAKAGGKKVDKSTPKQDDSWLTPSVFNSDSAQEVIHKKDTSAPKKSVQPCSVKEAVDTVLSDRTNLHDVNSSDETNSLYQGYKNKKKVSFLYFYFSGRETAKPVSSSQEKSLESFSRDKNAEPSLLNQIMARFWSYLGYK